MADILILYSTVDGHTRRICERLQRVIEQSANRVALRSIDEPGVALERFDKVVIGASIRYGKHRESVYRFVADHRAALDAKPNAFFTVNVVARKPQKNTPDTNPYMKQFLRLSAWRPKLLGVFAGRIEYRLYRFTDRWIIRFIMWITNGPTDLDGAYEFTDWDAVDAFARRVAAL